MHRDQAVAKMEFRPISRKNFNDFRRIYQQGITTGMATFETETPSFEKWDASRKPFGRIALYDHGEMLGWATLSPVSDRCVYRGVAEVSVYVSSENRGKKYGELLLKELIRISEDNEIWTLNAAMMRENTASLKLHEKCGFRVVGYREKIGRLNGIWRDNILMERRSKIIGIKS